MVSATENHLTQGSVMISSDVTLLATYNSVVRRAMSSQLQGFFPCWLILLSGVLCPLTLLANSVVRRAMSSYLAG